MIEIHTKKQDSPDWIILNDMYFNVNNNIKIYMSRYVMFIASIVRNYLFQGLKKVSKKEKDKKSYTVPASISELEKVTTIWIIIILSNYLQSYYLTLPEIRGLRYQKLTWENAGARIVVSGQIDKRMISADWIRQSLR